MPLTDKAVTASLTAPKSSELRLRAANLTHPLLKPITLDTSDGLSPDEAAVLAVILNPGLRAERDKKGIAGSEIIRAGILPNPHLSYSFEIPVAGVRPNTVNAYGLGLGMDIKALITREARLSAAKAHLASVELEVAWQEWQVAESAKLGLYRLIIANKRAGLEAKREKILKKIYTLTKRGVELGLKTSEDLSRASSALEDESAALIKAEGVVVANRLSLNRLLGLPPGFQTRPEKTVNMALFTKVPTIKSLTEGLDNHRLDLRALRLGYKSEEARLRVAILSQFPSINIGALTTKDTDSVKTAGGLLDVEIPIFNRNQGSIAGERATRKRLFDEYTARIFKARSMIARTLNNLTSISKRIAKKEKNAQKIQRHVRAYKQSLEEGVFNAIDYYDQKIRLQERRLEVLGLKEQELAQAISLEVASGQYIFTKSAVDREKSDVTEKAEVLR